MFRSSIRSAFRGGSPRVTPASKRTFASHASVEEEAREASKWEKISYVAIISSTILAVVNLSKGHPHSEEPPVSFVNQFVLLSLFPCLSIHFRCRCQVLLEILIGFVYQRIFTCSFSSNTNNNLPSGIPQAGLGPFQVVKIIVWSFNPLNGLKAV